LLAASCGSSGSASPIILLSLASRFAPRVVSKPKVLFVNVCEVSTVAISFSGPALVAPFPQLFLTP